jgi:hypothetical protein
MNITLSILILGFFIKENHLKAFHDINLDDLGNHKIKIVVVLN